jgi:hypothetical protein
MEACVYRVYKIEPSLGPPYASSTCHDWSTKFDELKFAALKRTFVMREVLFARPVE